MTNLFRSRFRRESRSDLLTLDEVAEMMSFSGTNYPLLKQTLGGRTEEIGDNLQGLAEGAYKRNGIVFACMVARMMLFSEARFKFRRHSDGKLFGTQALEPLERPSTNQTTGDLLSRMIQDADLGGNWYATRRAGNVLRRLRPDWVTIVVGFDDDIETPAQLGDIDAEVVGFLYHPGGRGSGRDPEPLLREHVAHWAPIPDPTAFFRGMSWLSPVVREVMGDKAMTEHKLKFVQQGATPNLVVRTSIEDIDEFKRWTRLFSEASEGLANAYRNLYLMRGAEAEVVGKDLKEVDFKRVQGSGETRIAAAARVPPIIVGLSEGLEASTYSNYGQARRAFADLTMRPLWRSAAGALASVIDVPRASELWYFDRGIPFLQEDIRDMAEIQQKQATAMRELIDGGYEPDSVTAAVVADDLSLLRHTGRVSVQLQTPGEGGDEADPALPARRAAALASARQLAALPRVAETHR